jgi:hypothetical protein
MVLPSLGAGFGASVPLPAGAPWRAPGLGLQPANKMFVTVNLTKIKPKEGLPSVIGEKQQLGKLSL